MSIIRSRFFSLILVAGALFLVAIRSLWADINPENPIPSKKDFGRSKILRWPLEDSLLFQKATLGSITALASTLSPVDSQRVIVAAGQYGAVYFSGKGEALSTVKFERKGYRMAPIDLKGDGKFAFMNRGGNGQQVGLFDSEGQEAWRYGLGANQTPNVMAAGDLNGDGEPEFVVGMNGNGGVRLLDATGKEKWRQPDVNVWQVEILDADGDRKNEIVHSNVTGRVCIRDAEGQLRREFPGKTHIAAFSVCTWPDAVGQWALLCNSQLEGIQLLDFSGNLLTRFAPPAKGRRVYGTPLRLSPEEKPYFALLVCDCVPYNDSWLFLYNANGDLVFEKRLLSAQAALLAVPNESSDSEKLLVGENEGAVWQIRRKPGGPASRN